MPSEQVAVLLRLPTRVCTEEIDRADLGFAIPILVCDFNQEKSSRSPRARSWCRNTCCRCCRRLLEVSEDSTTCRSHNDRMAAIVWAWFLLLRVLIRTDLSYDNDRRDVWHRRIVGTVHRPYRRSCQRRELSSTWSALWCLHSGVRPSRSCGVQIEQGEPGLPAIVSDFP